MEVLKIGDFNVSVPILALNMELSGKVLELNCMAHPS
jgi:hypothetical protein